METFDAIEMTVRRRRNEHAPFNQLPVDIVHLIFRIALDLNQIHDYDLPLDDLEQHHKQLLNMRCVSAGWNAFLLSSPEYWCTIDIAAPEPVVELILVRAQETPLCLYSKQGTIRDPDSLFDNKESVLLDYSTQVRTIRSDDEDVCEITMRMLRNGLPDLQTLELTEFPDWEFMEEEFVPEYTMANLPEIRHLITVGWKPGAEAMWLQNLQTLVLKPPLALNVDLLNTLRACGSLSKLILHTDHGPNSAEDMADAPSLIDLPRLQEINIEVDLSLDAGCIVPVLRLPGRCQRFLRIIGGITFDVSPSDLCQFLYSHTGGLAPPEDADIQIYYYLDFQSRVTYTVGKGRLDLYPREPLWGWPDEFHALVQAVQAHIKNPPLSFRLCDTKEDCLSILRRLADLNATKIWVESREPWGAPKVLDVLGSNHPTLPFNVAEDEDWPFESLRELTIKRASVDVDYLTRMIRIRQPYLQKLSKTWLEMVKLVDCSLYGTKIEQAVMQMAAMGVTLVNSNGSSG